MENNKNLLNFDIITPNKNVIALIGQVSKLNIFEFSGSQEFEPEGLFSTKVFGAIGSNTRNETFGYIDLGVKILHPLVYEFLLSINTLYASIILGKTKAIFKDGDFVESEEGRTGIYFFMKYIEELKLEDNGSDQRRNKIDIIKKYGNKANMSNYILVLPAGLRDYSIKENGTPSEDDINNMYRTLISISNTVKNINVDMEDEMSDLYNTIIIGLHDSFLKIYNYIKDILDGKTGLIQSKWTKRSIKYGTRNVITPSTNLVKDLRSPNFIKPSDTVIGLHQYISAISPLFKRGLVNIVSEVFDSEANKAYLYEPKTLKPILRDISPKDKKDWVSYEGIENLMDKFSQDDYKYLPVKINGYYLGLVRDDGKNVTLYFNEEVEIDKNVRPITYLELFYLIVYDNRNKYPGMVTRFPVDSMRSSYLCTFYLKTTIEDRQVNYKHNNEEKIVYNYPLLDQKPFNSLSPHFTRIEGLNADHDGDMVSTFIFFSDESISETNERIKSLNYLINPNGGMMTSVCIPPVNNLFLHLTDTLKSGTIVISYEDLVNNTSKEKVHSELSIVYNKSFGGTLKDKDIDTWLEEGEIYLAIDTKENILGYMRIKHFNINHLDDDNKNYGLFVNTDNFIFLSDIASLQKGCGRVLMNYLHYRLAVGNDIILRAHNKSLIPYYEQYEYSLQISTLLKGNVMVKRA